jgi:hypothetical protein
MVKMERLIVTIKCAVGGRKDLDVKNNNLKQFEQDARKIMNEAITLLVNKRKDYGENALRGGQVGIAIRLSDKQARLENLLGITDGTFKQREAIVGDEQISDTVRDILNYSLLFLMEGKKK